MTTQTEKLKRKIQNISMADPTMAPFYLAWEQIDLVLQACKEAGLKFVKYKGTDEYHPYPIRYDEEIEI